MKEINKWISIQHSIGNIFKYNKICLRKNKFGIEEYINYSKKEIF